MALPQDETTTEQPSIDYEALGLEPVSDEELFGFGLQTEAPETPKAETPEIDYEGLGLEPVSDKELFGFEMPKEQSEPTESFLRPVADPLLNIGAGINDVVKGFTDAFGADNAVSQNLAKNSEWYRSLLSAGAKQDQEEIGRIMQEADGQGVLAEVGAGLKALSVAPVDLVSQGIGSLIPFIATAGLGKAAGLSKAGIAVLQGVQGGVVGGGIVKGEIYNAVKEQLINSGVDEAKAEKAANEAQAYNGKNLDQILLGVGLGVAASTTGADSAIRSLISRKVGKEAAEQVSEQAIQEVLRTGFVRGAVKDGIVEAATEGLQGGQERLAANIAVGREGFEVEPMRGVFGQATLEGALGGIIGGGAGGISAKVEQMDARQKVALRDAQKAAEEAKQSNAPASAAAVEEQINQTIEETPDEKVARLQREAQEAAGDIELEEEGAGLPPVEPTPPVTPTPEAAVAPVEPVVAAEGAVEPAVTEVAPEVRDAEYVASVERGDNEAAQRLVDSAFRAATTPETVDSVFERHKDFKMMGLTLEEIAQNPEALAEKDKDDYDTVMYWVSQIQQGNTPTVVADEKGSLWDGFHRLVASKIAGGETLNVFTSEKETSTDQLSQTVRRDAEGNVIPLSERFPTAPTAPIPTAEVAPAVTLQLEPLRRVARAEQTEEDVAGLVDAGFVEVYNGQPVLTQAGLDALPEAERPRLTPEARKIQIDTRTSEAAAEAISKNLRIGVDQVPVDVRMPSGWTLEGDVYVPPQPTARITPSDIETAVVPEEAGDVFANLVRRKQEVQPAVLQKPVGSQFQNPEEFRAAFDLRGQGHTRFAIRLDLMQEDGAITEDGKNLILATIWDNNTNDEFLSNMEMGSARKNVKSYGFGGRSRQTVEGGKVEQKPLLELIRETRRGGGSFLKLNALTLNTFWHEFGHAGYYSLLDAKQKKEVDDAYNKTTRAGRRAFFAEGKSDIENTPWFSKYYAKNESEWFAQSFAEYVITQKSDQKKLVPVFEQLLDKIKAVFTKLFNRKEQVNLNDIFDFILRGEAYGQRPTWQGYTMSTKPAVYGTPRGQAISPEFTKRLLEREQPTTFADERRQQIIDGISLRFRRSKNEYGNNEFKTEYDFGGRSEIVDKISFSLEQFDDSTVAVDYFPIKDKKYASIRILELENSFKGRAAAERAIKRAIAEIEMDERVGGAEVAPTPEVREARREPAITPQQDRDYLDAVERGDLDAASRMVEDAAKAAGYIIGPLYHGTRSKEFYVFQAGGGEGLLFFSTDENFAREWAEQRTERNIGKVRVIPTYISANNPWDYLNENHVSNLIKRLKEIGGRSDTEIELFRDDINSGQWSVLEIPDIIRAIKSIGHDGIWMTEGGEGTRNLAVFNSKQIKSAEPVTRDDQGNIIPLSQRFQPEQADIRYNPLGYDITTVVEDIKAGRTDGPLRAVNNVVREASAFRDRVKAESLRRQQPRARGKAAILERIARERSSGKLSEETAQALSDFVNSIRNEAIGDTAISIRGAGGASNFDFGQSLVSFFLTQDQPKIGARVGIHEFWHGLARFLPQKEVDQMTKDYTKALGAYLKKNPWFLAFVGRYSLTPEQFEAYKIFNPKEAETKLVPVLDREGNPVKYQIKYDADNYRYIMLDEWIAEKMTDLVRGKQAIPDTFMGKLAKIIRDFMAMIRSKLGRDPYQSFYNLVTDPNQKIDLQRMAGVARPFQIYQPQDYDYSKDISDQIRYAPMGAEGREYRAEGFPTFTEGTPEAATLKEMATSMAKVDAASEAKGGKPETYKISEIASVWMDSGLGERELQDAITEYTNLTPANAARVVKAIARQYDIQQSIATAFLETQTGLSVEALPEGVTLPKEVDPDRPKPVMQRLFDVFMGVRVPPVKIEVNEKTALKDQIRLKAAANRAAKAEQKRTAEEVVEIIKAMELLGPVRPKQVQALAKRAARVIWTSEKSVEAFSEYAAKVVENANYDADLREAKDAQKRAKQLSKQKKVAMSPQRQILEDVGRVPVNKLDDPRMFAEAVNYYLRGFKDVLSPDYVVIPDAEMESYLSGAQSETQRNQRDLDREANQRLAEKYGIDPEQVNEMMESIDIIKQIEAQENREALNNLLTEKAVETQQGLRGYDTNNISAEQRPIVAAMLKVDPKALDPEERQRFIRITNNIIYNNQTNGSEYFLAVAKGQQSAREAAQDSTMVAKNRAWINLLPRFVSERMQRGWALELQSVADTFRNAFGKGAMAKMYDAIGMLDLNLGFTKANNVIDEIQEKIAEFHRNLEKKYKAAARNQDGLLAEGVVGFLIQSVPKKDEVSSINQRRDLIRQDIANRRRATGEPDRVAMADRIEAILNRIDGDSVEAILNNMKREFPANHESLIWYKDTLLPQYKDFLKSFDENFNDQANNYENPNYLTIGFTSAGPSLAITPEEQNLFYDQVSLRPKQSAYTIKRVDYTKIPDGKEIEFNLRRNVFNSLSDQINKAYTSSGWQRIASFMKTPEAEVVFGGSANKDFFIERLNRLRLSRMRRGSMGRGGAIEKAVDSLSIISRKLGTGIALGGVYQWIKQPPDQLITALGSGGRADLLAKNIAPSTQKAARELLNKFSIGRRGDASSGYKYINQMEGHQNRLERYFSESKWDQAKEQAGKIADVWMVALKSSDFLAASAAWMTYYEGELNKQDIKIDDWSKEAELIESDPKRRQAAAFAEQMTDIYQGSSDPTSMATFAQSGKTGWENLVKAIFVPFNSFAIQQRMRLYSDARDAINGTSGGKGGLAGTVGGLILFHATKRYVIPAISGAGIAVLYGLMGVDMDEPDEEKQKEEANKNWRQFLADITGNLLVGGTPQIIESQFIDAMNRASYLVALQLENDSILNDEGEIMSYDQYSKERSPFYRYKSFDNAMSLGMLEIGLGQAEQVALQTKMLATPEEMEMYTPEEQRMLYFSALSEWLYLMRLNDADFARLVSKARRDMIKAAKEREAELQRIRSGR